MLKRCYKGLSLLEIIFAIVLVSIIASMLTPKVKISKINLLVDRLILHLEYTRYIAMTDDKYQINDLNWSKELWTIKFQDCQFDDKDGQFYVIYSDTNRLGGVNKEECLRDPVTNKYIYSHHCDADTVGDKSRYSLLKEFDVADVDISCIERDFSKRLIGKISFGHDGKIYSKLTPDEVEITETCYINLHSTTGGKHTIAIEPTTGFVYKVN